MLVSLQWVLLAVSRTELVELDNLAALDTAGRAGKAGRAVGLGFATIPIHTGLKG